MTYRDLLIQLSSLTAEQLDTKMTVLTIEGSITDRVEVKVADKYTDSAIPAGSIYIDA